MKVWDRLYLNGTFSTFCRTLPPLEKNSLDLVLDTGYDHSRIFLASKAETLLQPETWKRDDVHIGSHRKDEVQKIQRQLGHVIKGVDSPHTPQTNGGFSRKPDGGYYTS